MRAIDPDVLKAFQLKVWKYKQGELVSLMVHLGTRFGLYGILAEAGPMSSGNLATAAELDERWIRGWLLGQAAAGLLTRDGDVFEMTPEASEVLVDTESLAFAGGAFDAPTAPDAVETIITAFQTGRGVTYDAMGDDMAEAIDSQGAPWLRDYLIDEVILSIAGIADRLEEGAVVADIGCGGGISTEALARRYPNATFVGVDPSRSAAAMARRRLVDLDNASVVEVLGEDVPGDARYDFVMTLDCMHDVPFPDKMASGIRRAIKDDGVWLIKDMRATSDWDKAMKNPTLALQYGYSISGCLMSATSSQGGAGLGTLGFTPEVAQRIASDAGFSQIERLPIKSDPVHSYYAIRP